MGTNKLTLYQTTGRDATKRITAVLNDLDQVYLKHCKRRLPADLLFMSNFGDLHAPTYAITAHYERGQEPIVTFLQQHLSSYGK